MRILQISDTHNKHLQLTNLPAADVIAHCGNFTNMGTEQEQSFQMLKMSYCMAKSKP